MAIHLAKPSKYPNWIELWSRVSVKLILYAVDVKEVYRINHKGLIKDLKSDMSLRIEVDSAKVKSEEFPIGQTLLNQFFFLDLSDSSTSSMITASIKSGKHSICEANFGQWSQYPHDTIIEKTVDMFFPVKERTKSSPADIAQRVLGKLTCRFVLTKATGAMELTPLFGSNSTIPTGSGFLECNFYDDDKTLRKSLKTGDLIAFHEGGLLGHCMNLSTNTNYSRVGLVIRNPDKYTGKEHLYVVELTSNPQRFIDALRNEPTSGVSMFRLWERLRSIQGGSIWLLPLLEPLAADPLANLVDFVLKSVSSGTLPPENVIGIPPPDILPLLQDLGIKEQSAQCELMSASLCAGFLKMGGKRLQEPTPIQTISDPGNRPATTPAFFTPAYLIAQTDVFGPLVPLRTQISQNQS